ncbi:MAG: MBL fold metallo-hydrolase [Chlamydiales bacterium]|nr:MBL fold metallo-hydrolase [Chlamydiales bacterium]
MKGFCPLASGSKGNCLYLGTDKTKILIDAGIGVRRIQQSLEEIGVSLSEIDAVLITHEHADHIRAVDSLSSKYNIPIFANSDTAKGICAALSRMPNFKIFSTGETFEFRDLQIHPFSIQHDTLDPVAFTIQTPQFKLGICADLGFVTTLVKSHLQNCDYLYIEANHEPEMVHASARPMIYKQRVLGRQGHLSNAACAELLKAISHEGLKGVFLAHLSSECNNPHLALEIASEALSAAGCNIPIHIAHQDTVSTPIIFSA